MKRGRCRNCIIASTIIGAALSKSTPLNKFGQTAIAENENYQQSNGVPLSVSNEYQHPQQVQVRRRLKASDFGVKSLMDQAIDFIRGLCPKGKKEEEYAADEDLEISGMAKMDKAKYLANRNAACKQGTYRTGLKSSQNWYNINCRHMH